MVYVAYRYKIFREHEVINSESGEKTLWIHQKLLIQI